MKTAAIIVAAGRGVRAGGGDIPKQYRDLAGETVLLRTLGSFVRHSDIDAVLTVIHDDDHALYSSASGAFSSGLLAPVTGGETRQASVYAGLQALQDVKPAHILIHDAARPFPSSGLIGRVTAALASHDGVVPALSVTDTLKKVENGRIVDTIDRGGLWRAQTPQGFAYGKILDAHKAAHAAGRNDFTDDASLAEWHGLDVSIVDGDTENIKLTSIEDFAFAEAMLRQAGGGQMNEMRVGQGFDVHAFDEGDHVVLCGLEIPHDKALSGHSDADVALHALTDALLGAIGDGDIGAHFPPSDPKWRGASSDLFLRDAARRIREREGKIVNVDITILCELPKIGPHREAMRKRTAQILDIAPERVSVKATTTEGLGFTGRGEGIAAQASALVRLGR